VGFLPWTLFFLSLGIFLSLAPIEALGQNANINATLSIHVEDENKVAIPGATVKAISRGFSAACETDFSGSCRIGGLPLGTFTIQVSKNGFYVSTVNQYISQNGAAVEITLSYQQEVKENVTVSASREGIDPDETAMSETLNSNDIINIPYPTTRDVRTLLPFIPGVVLDNTNQPHVAGAATYQSSDILDGFNIKDPVSGLLNLRISADAIRKIDVEQSRYSAEYGKASGGLIALETGMGDDRYRFSATNFVPSFEVKKGLNFDKWVPRATFSGPLVQGRAWFFLAPDAEYDSNIFKDLPDGADRAPLMRVSNLAKAQINLGNADILTASFLFNSLDQHHSGLSLLNPQPVTSNIKQFAYLPSVKEQHTFSNGVLAEVGIAWLAINNHERPLGDLPFVVRPEGNSGNFFRTSDSDTRRLQGLFNLYLPSFEAFGRHELKFGLDLDNVTYDKSVNRKPISVLREDGTLSEQVTFPGPQNFSKNNFETGAYIQDRWSFAEHWLVEAGLRFDRDSIIRSVAVDPRFSVVFSPSDSTKVSGGIGLFYDETNLELVTRPLQGPRVEQLFAADGNTVTSVRQVTFEANAADLKPPRSLNWSLSFEQKLPGQNYFRADFIQRRGRDGLAYVNESIPSASVIPLELRSVREDHYDALQASVRHTFKAGNVVFISYVRSSARSSPIIDFALDQIFEPLFTAQNSGPLPWDTPNNVLSYGWFPLPKSFQFSYTFQWRTGFPFSLVNQQQEIAGEPNSQRFPDYFNLGAYLEKRFPLFGLNWAVRGGFDNITGHQNPTVVNNNIDSPQFLRFSESSGRSFTARIRFLGRK
jgi:hypothetical protein